MVRVTDFLRDPRGSMTQTGLVFVLLTLVLKGAGPLSLDRVLAVWRTGDRGN